ncbi:Tim10/DDP family zinc finger protein, partial [Prunus dulcis]
TNDKKSGAVIHCFSGLHNITGLRSRPSHIHPRFAPKTLNRAYTSGPMAAAPNNAPTAVDKEQIFGMAEKEMEYRVELFNKLTHTCFNKCVEKKYKEAELNMGENSCIDRCVSKYWHVTNLVGQLLGAGRPPIIA